MSAPTRPETVLDSLEEHAAKGLARQDGTSGPPWSCIVEAPRLAALCVLARAAIADFEDLSPEEAAAVEVLERES